jgi:hypothetical protein
MPKALLAYLGQFQCVSIFNVLTNMSSFYGITHETFVILAEHWGFSRVLIKLQRLSIKSCGNLKDFTEKA